MVQNRSEIEEQYDAHGNLRERLYWFAGNCIARIAWDASGEVIRREPWNTGWEIGARSFYQQKIQEGSLTETECRDLQMEFQQYLFPQKILEPSDIRYIAGVDLAYWQDDMERAVCCIVITDFHTKEIVERVQAAGEIRFPYIPGLLAFRELPLVLEAAAKLEIQPDVWMFDGNGQLHPRRMGLAAMAPLFLEKPALGVAKSYYKVGDTEFTMPEEAAGSTTDILVNGQILGCAVRTSAGRKPVFVSVGNFMDIRQAVWLTMELIGKESRIPIPTRQADLDTHTWRRLYQACGAVELPSK